MSLSESYCGPVELVGTQHSVSAYAEYEVRVNHATGVQAWRGFVTHIDPIFSLEPEAYELRRPDGTAGRVFFRSIDGGTSQPQVATFLGLSSAPGSSEAGRVIDRRQSELRR